MLSATDDQLIEWLRGMFAPVDQAALTGEFADYLVACLRHSVHQGIVGWRDDTLAHTRPWDFDVGQISVPVSVWHGTHDGNLSSAHGAWLSEHIPGARADIIEGEGHVSLILRIEQVLDDLLERAGLSCRPGSAPLTS